MQDVAMFQDLGSFHMTVTGGRTVSAQNTAGDHVKTSSRAVRSSNNESSSSCGGVLTVQYVQGLSVELHFIVTCVLDLCFQS